MAVLHVAAECQPLLKTGGLADVIGALPAAQRDIGIDARILLPGFPAIRAGLPGARMVGRLPDLFGGGEVALWQATLANGTPVYYIEAPALYDRGGNPYADADQHPYADNHRRFALLGWVAAEIASGFVPGWRPQIIHGHDWHAGLAAAYLRQQALGRSAPTAGSVFTVHNLAYQGLFPAWAFGELGLPDTFFHMDGLEFHDLVSFIKAGLYYSDRIATVSPTYAAEIQLPEYGCGLDGLLAGRNDALVGILNGVDEAAWDPAGDAALVQHYDAADLAGKAACKAALQAELGLQPSADAPVFGVVSRLTEQKGLNLILAGAEAMLARGGQLAILGSGEPALEQGFKALAQAHVGRVAVHLGFDEPLSHRLFAGADVALVPSRFEPCGLTQLYGLRYGALPLVRRTGGLADTVNDSTLENLADASATGFVFERFDQADFDAAVRRAYALYADPLRWRAVQLTGMAMRFGWREPAQAYGVQYGHALASAGLVGAQI